jgi:hypothetical protein
VHEPRAVHRLERGADRFAVPSEALTQVVQSSSVRRSSATLDRRTLAIEQVEVETLATQIAGRCPGGFMDRDRRTALYARLWFTATLVTSIRSGFPLSSTMPTSYLP